MTPASMPPERRDSGRLLVVDTAADSVAIRPLSALPSLLEPPDLLVVNDAATLPAALRGRDARGRPLELRLASQLDDSTWLVVALGPGDHRTPTEVRPDPPPVTEGERVTLGAEDPPDDLVAVVVNRDPTLRRLWVVRFEAPQRQVLHYIYTHGRPVQYAYVPDPLPLWSVQTVFAGPPWAVEMPSAGRVLSARLLEALRKRGVALSSLTHAAGLSSSGEAALDERLPLPERAYIPERTAAAILQTKRRGGRVIAVGTSVTRALEDAAVTDEAAPHTSTALPVQPGQRLTTLRLSPSHVPRIVDGLLSGVHSPGESHYALLSAFASPQLLARATTLAAAQGLALHEFGDSTLILPASAPRLSL